MINHKVECQNPQVCRDNTSQAAHFFYSSQEKRRKNNDLGNAALQLTQGTSPSTPPLTNARGKQRERSRPTAAVRAA
jgi:hypothetical protein